MPRKSPKKGELLTVLLSDVSRSSVPDLLVFLMLGLVTLITITSTLSWSSQVSLAADMSLQTLPPTISGEQVPIAQAQLADPKDQSNGSAGSDYILNTTKQKPAAPVLYVVRGDFSYGFWNYVVEYYLPVNVTGAYLRVGHDVVLSRIDGDSKIDYQSVRLLPATSYMVRLCSDQDCSQTVYATVKTDTPKGEQVNAKSGEVSFPDLSFSKPASDFPEFRYLRILTNMQTSGCRAITAAASIAEIEVYDANGNKINPIASSIKSGSYLTLDPGQDYAWKAFDGDADSRWFSGHVTTLTKKSADDFLKADFGSIQKYSRIRILPAPGTFGKFDCANAGLSLTIQGSNNGVYYKTIKKVTPDMLGQWQWLELP